MQTDARPSAELLGTLGNALSARAAATGSGADAGRAIRYLRTALRRCGAPERPAMLSNLAAALLDRYDLTGAIADVEEAANLLEEAVDGTPPGSRARAPRLSNLGSALRLRQLRQRRGRADLDLAMRAYEEALELTPEADPDRITYHANLGNVLHQRYDVTHDPADLNRAIRELSSAVDSTPPDSPDRAIYLNNLCATLSARGDREHDPADLEPRPCSARRWACATSAPSNAPACS